MREDIVQELLAKDIHTRLGSGRAVREREFRDPTVGGRVAADLVYKKEGD